MKRKIFSFLFALVLVCSFSLVMAVPVAAIVVPSTFTVTGGTYTTTPVDDGTVSADIGATLEGEWDTAVIGDFTATGQGKVYPTGGYPDNGTTATVDITVNLSADEITFEGTAVWGEHDYFTADELTGITGDIVIQPDGAFVADLVGLYDGQVPIDIDMTGSMMPVADLGVEITSTNVEGPYSVGVEQGFRIRSTSDDPHAPVLFKFVVANAALADITSFKYYDVEFTQDWYDMPLIQEGSNLEGYFGPASGFEMPAGDDTTTLFSVNFATAKTYPVTISLDTVGGEITATSFEVVVQPHENTIASSTMIFEGTLTDEGGGVFTGEIPMVDELSAQLGDFVAGFDVYAEEGGTAYVEGMDPETWTILSDHDAYSKAGPWGSWYDPDCADWNQFSLKLTADHWYLLYTTTGEAPMSGTMYWYGDGTGYAAETDPGTLDGTDPTQYTAGSAQEWGWDCGWGEERIPLELPGFAVEVTPGGSYTVTLTPTPGPVSNSRTGITYGTIQLAIDAPETDAGDTINVAVGEYSEIVLVDESVTLLGKDKDTTIITDEGAGYSGITNYATIGVGVNDVTISGFTVKATGNAGRAIHVSSWFNTHYAGQGFSPVPSNIEVSDNNIFYPSTGGKKTGIGMYVTENVVIRGNTIVGEESGVAKGIGIYIDYQEYGGDRNNYGSGYIIEGNVISGGSIGMSLGCITDFTISGNTVSGMSCDLGGGDADHAAIEVWCAYNGTIERNTVTNNYNGIAVWSDPGGDENVEVHYNNMVGNTNLGLVASSKVSQVVDATHNWWGKKTGPYHATLNPGVTGNMGNAVSDNVNFSPWLYKTKAIVPTKEPAYAQSVVLDNYGTYGWNTFSTPIVLDDTANTWAKLITLTGLNYDIAYRFDLATQKFVNLETGENYAITPGEGFFIKMKTAGSLPILYSTAENLYLPSRPLTVGFNLIGLASLEDLEASYALKSLAGEGQVVSPTGNVEPGAVLAVDTVYVGEAYWAYMLSEETLVGFTMTPVNWMP